jgi:hypothetical protein
MRTDHGWWFEAAVCSFLSFDLQDTNKMIAIKASAVKPPAK